MPGALDVLVEIQFSANDAVLKEINAQLEKESNILKTIEERLKQLNTAASGQGAIGQQLKLINKEIEQTNKLLLRMQTSYKEVDYAGESLKKQNTVWSNLALAIREAPDASTAFKATLFELIAQIPNLTNTFTAASRSGTGFAGVIGGMGKSIVSAQSMISLGAVAITLLADKMLEQSAAAKAADEANRKYLDSIKRINESTDASIIQETTKLDILYKTATNKNALPDARKAAANEMKEAWPVMFKNYSIWQIMEGKATAAVEKTTEAIKARTKADGDMELLAAAKEKRAKELADEEEKRKKVDPNSEKDAQMLERLGKANDADPIDSRNTRSQIAMLRKPKQEYDAAKAKREATDKEIADIEKRLLANKAKGDPSQATPDPVATYTSAPEKDTFLDDINKMYDDHTKAKAKILAEDAAISKGSIEATVEAERKAAFEKLNILIEEKKKERQLTEEEEQEIAKTRVAINSKYSFQLLNELNDHNSKKTELNRSVAELQTENDKKQQALKEDDLQAQMTLIDINTKEQIQKTNERYDALRESAKNLSLDTQAIEQERNDALAAIQIESQIKSLDAQIKFLDKQSKLIDTDTSRLLAEADAEAQQGLPKTRNPRNKAILTTQSSIAKNQIEQGSLSEKLEIATRKRDKLREGGPGITTAEVAESEANVAKIESQIEQLKSAYQDMNAELAKQKVERVTGVFQDVNTSIQQIGGAVDTFMAAEQAKTEGLIEEQQKRVDRAKEFAEDGNTAMLEAEQERLNALEKKHKEYAEKRKSINAILVASQQAVNVAQAIGAIVSAAAQGDPYTIAFRVIAAVAALVAGVAAVSGAMKGGGEGYAEGGYTGDGAKRAPAGTVHRGEYVMPQETVQRYGIAALEAIHHGRIPTEALTGKMMSVNYAGMLHTHQQSRTGNYDMRRLESKFDLLLEAYNNNGGTQLNIDENGLVAIYNEHIKNKTRINKLR